MNEDTQDVFYTIVKPCVIVALEFPVINTSLLELTTDSVISATLEASGIGVTWAKISGPEWLYVAEDGMISGITPKTSEINILSVKTINAKGYDIKNIDIVVNPPFSGDDQIEYEKNEEDNK
jgi:hypothetical protein